MRNLWAIALAAGAAALERLAAQLRSAGSKAGSALAGLSSRHRLLKRLRAAWGVPGDKDGWLASRYFDLARRHGPGASVDDQTWVDLEFPALFRQLDGTVTPIGSQCLFARLRTYVDDEAALREAYDLYRTLSADAALREHIQVCLARLEADSGALVIDLLLGDQRNRLRRRPWLRAWSGVCLLLLLATALQFLSPLVIVALLLVNGCVILRAHPNSYQDVEALTYCNRMLAVADALAAIEPSHPVPQLTMLAADRASRQALRASLRWYALAWVQPLSLISNVLNFLLLWERLAFYRVIAQVQARRAGFVRTFELIGSLDASICIASFLAREHAHHCFPVVTSAALIDIADGYHPLLTAPVVNSVRLSDRSALVSGSNMTGKTTFIKMVGTNIIVGQTIGVCFASRATLPRSRAAASIVNEHSIVSGKSRYFSETQRVLSLIRGTEAVGPQVLLIDELFSGTNTRERVAAAYAVLKELSERAQVLATTHDVELQGLLASRFEMLSFVEDPDVPGGFDFRLRVGPSPVGNAIRLLEKAGFPASVIQDAAAALADPVRPHPPPHL
jgi:hypothetical protein